MLISERIRIIVEREIERLYIKATSADSMGLSEEDVKELKALYEIIKLQGLDREEHAKSLTEVDTQKLLEILKKDTDG